jgi:alanine racemase
MIIQPYAWIEISESALRHNCAQFRMLIGQHAALAPVIKSNAYGHGLDIIGPLMNNIDDVDWLCVGYLSEALALRSYGVVKPILVMSCIDRDPMEAINANIHFIVGSLEKLTFLHIIAQRHAVVFDIHLKIDTGLSRFGVVSDEMQYIIKHIASMQGIRMAGICTHFAESYKEDQSFTQEQIALFTSLISLLDEKPRWIHASNSAATVVARVPFANLFRVGLGVYGYWSGDFVASKAKHLYASAYLKPVLSFKTRIMEIKSVRKGATIGYDRTYAAQQPMNIALLPIGYHDGYDFRLCNNASIYCGDTRYALVGKVAMNTIAIDITHSPALLIGTEVTIIGTMPGITAPDIAQRIGEPNPRKILTSLAAHIPRFVVA